MKHDRVASCLLLLLGIGIAAEALRLPYSSIAGPGPGFFPLWIGVLMILLSALLFFTTRRPLHPFIEPGSRVDRVALVGASFLGFILVLNHLGLLLAAGLYAAFLVGVVERRDWQYWLLAGLLIGGGCFLLFGYWLGVPLPKGPLGI